MLDRQTQYRIYRIGTPRRPGSWDTIYRTLSIGYRWVLAHVARAPKLRIQIPGGELVLRFCAFQRYLRRKSTRSHPVDLERGPPSFGLKLCRFCPKSRSAHTTSIHPTEFARRHLGNSTFLIAHFGRCRYFPDAYVSRSLIAKLSISYPWLNPFFGINPLRAPRMATWGYPPSG